jgi:heme exporter protein D
MNDFFAMGGYAAYVWPSYIIAVATIAGMAIQTVTAWRRAQERLQALEKDAAQPTSQP